MIEAIKLVGGLSGLVSLATLIWNALTARSPYYTLAGYKYPERLLCEIHNPRRDVIFITIPVASGERQLSIMGGSSDSDGESLLNQVETTIAINPGESRQVIVLPPDPSAGRVSAHIRWRGARSPRWFYWFSNHIMRPLLIRFDAEDYQSFLKIRRAS